MTAVRGANLALKFLVELGALAAFAVWAASAASGVLSVLLAVLAVAVAAALWGSFAAPRARHRLPTPLRVPFELGFFLLAVAALVALDAIALAAAFAAAVLVNAALLTAFGDWQA